MVIIINNSLKLISNIILFILFYLSCNIPHSNRETKLYTFRRLQFILFGILNILLFFDFSFDHSKFSQIKIVYLLNNFGIKTDPFLRFYSSNKFSKVSIIEYYEQLFIQTNNLFDDDY